MGPTIQMIAFDMMSQLRIKIIYKKADKHSSRMRAMYTIIIIRSPVLKMKTGHYQFQAKGQFCFHWITAVSSNLLLMHCFWLS